MRTLRTWLQEQRCICGNGEENTWGDIYDLETPPHRSSLARLLTLIWRFMWPATPKQGDINLVGTRPRQHIDGFTRWVADEWVPFHSETKKSRQKRHANKDGGVEEGFAQRSSVSRPKPKSRHKRGFSKIHDTNNFLLCVAGFAVVFSVGLMLLTGSATTRVETFMATAA